MLDDVEEIHSDEAEIWAESKAAAKRIVEKVGSDDVSLQAYVSAVLDRLVDSSTTLSPERRPTITVLATVEANASAMPHGDLFITNGMLAQLENEAQLAYVLGHELVHYRNRHSLIASRNAANQRAKSVLIDIAMVALVGTPTGIGASDSAWQLALKSSYSRELETAADSEAVALLAGAGYDVNESRAVLKMLRPKPGTAKQSIFASHPMVDDRLAAVNDAIAELPSDQPGHIEAQAYFDRTAPLIVAQAEALLANDEYDHTALILDRYLERYPDDGDALFLKAEAIRAESSSKAASQRAAGYYRRAIAADNPPAEAFRELGLHHRLLGEHDEAAPLFAAYVKRAPDAIDAPLIASYMETRE